MPANIAGPGLTTDPHLGTVVFKQRWNQWLDQLGLRVSSLDALPQLCMLAMPVGLLSGGVFIAFRMLTETTQAAMLHGG